MLAMTRRPRSSSPACSIQPMRWSGLCCQKRGGLAAASRSASVRVKAPGRIVSRPASRLSKRAA
jgi:hypothetical protein